MLPLSTAGIQGVSVGVGVGVVSCKCCNIVIQCIHAQHTYTPETEVGLNTGLLTSINSQRHAFFSQELEPVINWTFRCEEQTLVETTIVDNWKISTCVLCKTSTHAVSSTNPRCALVPTKLKIDMNQFKEKKNSEKYSKIFNVLLEEPSEMTSIKKFSAAFSHPAAESLNKKLIKAIDNETERVEEAIRAFKDKKIEELEKFKDRVQHEHRIALSMLADNDNMECEFQPLHISKNDAKTMNYNMTANKPKSILSKTTRTDSKNTSGVDSLTEDSLDSEEMFEFEGMDSAAPNNGQNSDAYDSESDDSVSRDEGIHITRHNSQQYSSIAKSLPINVPAFSSFHDSELQESEHENPEYPHDIAASIKALARSVHGDVFEVPRPRFSTQI